MKGKRHDEIYFGIHCQWIFIPFMHPANNNKKRKKMNKRFIIIFIIITLLFLNCFFFPKINSKKSLFKYIFTSFDFQFVCMFVSFSSFYYVKWYKWYENIACKPASLPMSFSLFPPPPVYFLLCSVLWLYSQHKGILIKTLSNERTISLSCSVLQSWIKITHEATSAISPNERHQITRRKCLAQWKDEREKWRRNCKCIFNVVCQLSLLSSFTSYFKAIICLNGDWKGNTHRNSRKTKHFDGEINVK